MGPFLQAFRSELVKLGMPKLAFGYVTPRQVKRVAAMRGIDDRDPSFEHFARNVTGKTSLNQMNQWELHRMVRAMSGEMY